jgi:tetratricopeptide (TPR) repeat protein
MDLKNRALLLKNFKVLAAGVILLAGFQGGCASSSLLGVHSSEEYKPITNPFSEYATSPKKDASKSMVLRTKKGDRSVELEIPGDSGALSDFVLPNSPAFQENLRKPASVSPSEDSSYREKKASATDLEITSSFKQPSSEEQDSQREIEQGLFLVPSEDQTGQIPSYLARVDHIKKLYKENRYEAALLELDEILTLFPKDPKLHEMRGTVLDRIGRHELALKSWNQALKLDSENLKLKRFLEKKQGGLAKSP